MFKEFKEFIMRGNVLDMAIGVIIGGAFGKIVGSLVNDILMPLVGLALGGVNFSEQVTAVNGVELHWGLFIQAVIDFLIIALVIFIIVKAANAAKNPPAPAPATEPTIKECPHCFSAISIKATRCPNCTSQI